MSTTLYDFASRQDYEQLKGYGVLSCDHVKLGTIEEVYHPPQESGQADGVRCFRVRPGALTKFFSGQDEVVISERVIRRVYPEGATVVLDVPKRCIDGID
jgi:hypothetical protein